MRTTVRHWWQNDKTWTTREGVTILVEDLTPVHRSRILDLIARRSIPGVRAEMGWEVALDYAGADDGVLAEMDVELDIIDHGTDEEILTRMPLVRRLRELESAENEARHAHDARLAKAATDMDRADRRARRVAARTALIDDITALTEVAQENASQVALRAIRDGLMRTLTTSEGVSYRGRDGASAVAKGKVHDYGF